MSIAFLILGWVRLSRLVIQQDDRRMRILDKRCPWCNYERQISIEMPCPECGRLLAPLEPG
jgi:ribosomal protein S27E